MCGDPFTATGKAKLLGCGRLYIHAAALDLANLGQVDYHLGNKGGQFWALCNHRRVQVTDSKPTGRCQTDDMLEKKRTVDPPVGLISIREVTSYITKAQSTEDGIGDRMQ